MPLSTWYPVTTSYLVPGIPGTRYCSLLGTRYDLVVHRYTYLDYVYQVPVTHAGNGTGLWYIHTYVHTRVALIFTGRNCFRIFSCDTPRKCSFWLKNNILKVSAWLIKIKTCHPACESSVSNRFAVHLLTAAQLWLLNSTQTITSSIQRPFKMGGKK